MAEACCCTSMAVWLPWFIWPTFPPPSPLHLCAWSRREGRGDHQAGSSRLHITTAADIHMISERERDRTLHAKSHLHYIHLSSSPAFAVQNAPSSSIWPDNYNWSHFLRQTPIQMSVTWSISAEHQLVFGLVRLNNTVIWIQKATDLHFSNSFVVQWTHWCICWSQTHSESSTGRTPSWSSTGTDSLTRQYRQEGWVICQNLKKQQQH